MRPNKYLVQGLKYATLTLLGVVGVAVIAVALNQTHSGSVAGRLVSSQDRGIVPTVHFEVSRTREGFSVPTDTHVVFVIPEGVRIPRITFFGGADYDLQRYWGYCFSGHEEQNKANGFLGKAMYDGQFFYSMGERKAQGERPTPADNDLLGIKASPLHSAAPKASIAEIFDTTQGGAKTCYVMSNVILPASLDDDGDDVNNKREVLIGTDPLNPDTDGDGIPDGTELFVTKTNPLDPDTDHDGLGDRCEDKNMNGIVDPGETSPLVSDTDRDGLCDGNGFASGCPEPRQTVCFNTANNERHCDVQPASPVHGEDMNQNCEQDQGETSPTNPTTFGIADWDYKWNLFQAQNGNRKSGPGQDAYQFPIPALPVR